MNTSTTPASSAALTPSSNFTSGGRPIGSGNPDSAAPLANAILPLTSQLDQEMAGLQERMAEVQRLKEEAVAQEAAKAVARRKEAIAGFPTQLGVDSIEEVLAILRTEVARYGGVVNRGGGSKSKGNRIPELTLAQMRVALEGGMTIPEAARRFDVSEATISIKKKLWGLTNRGIGGGGKRRVPNRHGRARRAA